MSTVVSFKSLRFSTTANSTVTPVSIVGARLFSSTSAAITVHLHDTAGTTSASTRIGTLGLTGKGIDEIGYPLRVYSGTLVVTPTTTSGQVYIFVR